MARRATLITMHDTIVMRSAKNGALEDWGAPVPVEPEVRPDQDGSIISVWDPELSRSSGVMPSLMLKRSRADRIVT